MTESKDISDLTPRRCRSHSNGTSEPEPLGRVCLQPRPDDVRGLRHSNSHSTVWLWSCMIFFSSAFLHGGVKNCQIVKSVCKRDRNCNQILDFIGKQVRLLQCQALDCTNSRLVALQSPPWIPPWNHMSSWVSSWVSSWLSVAQGIWIRLKGSNLKELEMGLGWTWTWGWKVDLQCCSW